MDEISRGIYFSFFKQTELPWSTCYVSVSHQIKCAAFLSALNLVSGIAHQKYLEFYSPVCLNCQNNCSEIFAV